MLAGQAVGSRAGSQVDSGGVIQDECIGRIVGVDSLIELAVLVCDGNVGFIRRAKDAQPARLRRATFRTRWNAYWRR